MISSIMILIGVLIIIREVSQQKITLNILKRMVSQYGLNTVNVLRENGANKVFLSDLKELFFTIVVGIAFMLLGIFIKHRKVNSEKSIDIRSQDWF
ncbi:hypothetical protein RJG79_08995 [Mycoplasmatota bacterium WC44]